MKLSDKGFTILEVMQASALATVSMVGICSLLLTTVHANTKAQGITAAATAAQAKLEELRSVAFAELTDGADDVTESGAPYLRTWTVTEGPTAETKLVTVRVDGAQPPRVELRTIIAN